MEIILGQKAGFSKNLTYNLTFLEQQNKITTNSIDEQHKRNELHPIICGKTDFYVIKETI